MVLNLDGLTNTLSTTSGNNLIRDSIGCFNDGSWEGNYNLDSTAETRSRNQYGYALLLKNNSLKQQVNVANGVYTLSFVYKKLVNLANVKLLINGDEFILSNNDYTEFKHTFEISDGYITIVFECDTDNACPIINLMLNKGDEKMEWSLNSNETWSDTVKIGRGVRISSIGTDVEFVALADIIGFMNKQGEYITTFDSDGIVTNTAVIKNKAAIVNLLIQNINDQTILIESILMKWRYTKMANSGVLGGGGYQGRYLEFAWALVSQDIATNSSVIYWRVTVVGGTSSYYYHYRDYCDAFGAVLVNNNSRTQRYKGDLANGYQTVYHDVNGNFNFSAHVVAAVYSNTVNEDVTGSWSLPTIPRQATLTSMIENFTDEDDPGLLIVILVA